MPSQEESRSLEELKRTGPQVGHLVVSNTGCGEKPITDINDDIVDFSAALRITKDQLEAILTQDGRAVWRVIDETRIQLFRRSMAADEILIGSGYFDDLLG